jgi:hypothetical protein
VIEAAIAGRCQFLLIAGRLTESDQDLDLAVSWLLTQSTRLREHGVRLVLAGHPESDHAALRRLDAIILGPSQRLDVWSTAADRVEFSVSSRMLAGHPGALGIEVSGATTDRPKSELAYVAVPAVRPSAIAHSFDGVATAHDRLLRLSAGCPQAIGPAERGVFGCQLVEADLSRHALTARFCPTEVIRFAQELVSCRPSMQASQVCELLRERSRALGTSGRCTTVVEWVIDGQLALSHSGEESLSEMELLKDLRATLHAGHSGAWPCRIRFSENSSVDVAGHRSLVTHEFSAVVRDRFFKSDRWKKPSEYDGVGVPLCSGSEAAVGLDVLRRVA